MTIAAGQRSCQTDFCAGYIMTDPEVQILLTQDCIRIIWLTIIVAIVCVYLIRQNLTVIVSICCFHISQCDRITDGRTGVRIQPDISIDACIPPGYSDNIKRYQFYIRIILAIRNRKFTIIHSIRPFKYRSDLGILVCLFLHTVCPVNRFEYSFCRKHGYVTTITCNHTIVRSINYHAMANTLMTINTFLHSFTAVSWIRYTAPANLVIPCNMTFRAFYRIAGMCIILIIITLGPFNPGLFGITRMACVCTSPGC